MKLSAEVLAEIIDIVMNGIANGCDVSDRMRELDLVVDSSDPTKVTLSPEWVVKNRSSGPKILND